MPLSSFCVVVPDTHLGLAQSVAKVTKKAEATPEDDEFEDQLNFTLKMDCGEVKNPDSGIELTWQSDYGVGTSCIPTSSKRVCSSGLGCP